MNNFKQLGVFWSFVGCQIIKLFKPAIGLYRLLLELVEIFRSTRHRKQLSIFSYRYAAFLRILIRERNAVWSPSNPLFWRGYRRPRVRGLGTPEEWEAAGLGTPRDHH